MLSNKKLNPIVNELFIRDRKLNISFGFITHSYFAVPKNIKPKFYALFSFFFSNKNFNKSHFMIHQVLILKTL